MAPRVVVIPADGRCLFTCMRVSEDLMTYLLIQRQPSGYAINIEDMMLDLALSPQPAPGLYTTQVTPDERTTYTYT